MLSGISEDGTTVRLMPEFSIVSRFPERSYRYVLWAGMGAAGSLTLSNDAATRPAGRTKLTPIKTAHAPTVNATSRGSSGNHSNASTWSVALRRTGGWANQDHGRCGAAGGAGRRPGAGERPGGRST